MLRGRRVFLLILAGFMTAAHILSASPGLRVDEAATVLRILPGRAEVNLAVVNPMSRPVKARMRVEIINELNRVISRALIEETLDAGPNKVAAALWLPDSPTSSYVLWHRLRYYVSPIAETPPDSHEVGGVVSLSQICPDIFTLSVIRPPIAAPEAPYRIRVRAQHPVTRLPIEGVAVQAALRFEAIPPLVCSNTTDHEGYVSLEFDIPAGIRSDGEIKVSGQRNGISADEECDVRIDRTTRVSISTDKTIYQPGQTLHLRLLMLAPSRHAVGGAELTLKISDPEDTVVHRASVKTSRFGIASDDWAMPANTPLGDYKIAIQRDDSDEEHFYAPPYRVRVSRYELPNFTVTVKPNSAFYLPGQNAEVEIRGEYLFGQPVTRAHVRVVRETDREWNYREQKWEITEEDKYEGELDQSGRFVAQVDLSAQHETLAERDYSRMDDISYSAYITDLSTNRTEQRRFDLRVTKQPIHVYVMDDGPKARNSPLSIYVSTFYADGTPASCRVDISEDFSSYDRDYHFTRLRHLKSVTTNRYGVARAGGLVLTREEDQPAAARRYWDAELDITARDREGRTGHTSESVSYGPTDIVQVRTGKAIYKPGENIDVEIAATGAPPTLVVDVARRYNVVRSETVSLVNGRARLTVPYSRDFKDELMIAAYGHTKSNDFVVGYRTVMFPSNHELRLDAKTSRSRYRPGEQADVEFQIQTGDGRPAEGALGVTVIDRAVEERARTDAEFGGGHDFAREFYRLWGYEDEIAGVTLRSLDRLDLARPISPDLQLVAEILLQRRGFWIEETNGSIGSAEYTFSRILAAQLKPVEAALDSRYKRTRQYPSSAATLIRELADFGLDFPAMRDPWGTAYISRFSVSRNNDVLKIVSAGPDKKAGTQDDFTAAEKSWPYFRSTGEEIDRAVLRHHERTTSFIRDRRALKQELLKDGTNIDALRDRWGKPYRFEFGVSDNFFTVEARSSGADRRFDTKRRSSSDDFTLWTSKIDYFAGTRARIEAALATYFRETSRFPQDETQLGQALERASIDWKDLRDPWGNRYYATFKAESRYSDRVRIISWAQYLSEARQRTEVTPVTQQINFIYLRSAGKDGTEGTRDDFDAASYSRVVSEQTAQDSNPQPTPVSATLSGATGAVTGIVVDPNGAAISGATARASNKRATTTYEGKTNDAGRYLLGNLPAGPYEITFSAPGFQSTVIAGVPVNSSSVTELNVTLAVGMASETVMVTASGSEMMQTQSQSMSLSVNKSTTANLATIKQNTQASTPRLREYFPETLVWRPSIETDSDGRARLNFKLADNITTWKMSVIASTVDGEIGTAEKEILAFQPFFIEHDPPRVLTEGDEIELPVVLRNYLDKRQAADLQIQRAPWFELLSPERKRTEIAAGDSSREVFRFRAIASIDDGKQRVTASTDEANDAIEKPVSVHPDGQEIVRTATQVFSDSASIRITIPETSIRGSARAELKLYPNLMSHVIESIEGIMRRPHGCAEQTISSAYPSLLMLRYLKAKGDRESELAQKARRHVEAAYEILRNYRNEEGGFTYWGRGEADAALTAYALRFLIDARDVIAIEDDLINDSRNWLVKHQRADGSWPLRYSTDQERLPVATLTAFVARVLAYPAKGSDDSQSPVARTLSRALIFLSQRIDEIDEPHLIASYALAALNAGDRAGALRACEKLRLLAHDERDASYWKLETNTPFYGWGIAGRIEATAVAVQALAALEEANPQYSQPGGQPSRTRAELINRGLLFLLNQKDRYGVWYSTQATVNVLDALMIVLGKREPANTSANSVAEIFVNDKRAAAIRMPSDNRPAEPIIADISQFLSAGVNRVEIRRDAGSSQASAQIVESDYERWPPVGDPAMRDSASAGALRLQVKFDKTDAKINDEITCSVHAERVGFRGYGMLLAEIGLPPGADVDRASLERATKETGWGVDQYDVLPDRLIIYLWPQAGGTHFQFKLRPRYGLAAQSAPSVVYDYYNPEARAVVAPTRFTIR